MDARDWPDPVLLPDTLAPVSACNIDLLPETLKPWVNDICTRIQCSPDYVVVTVLTALGATIGRKIGIRPRAKDDWTEMPNQWGLIIGRPGVLKSPAMEAALAPLKRLTDEATAKYQKKVGDYEEVKTLAKLKHEENIKKARKAIKHKNDKSALRLIRAAKEDEPIKRRYIVNDTTFASLGEIHRQNPNGILVYRDEIVSLLRSLDQEDNSDARGFYRIRHTRCTGGKSTANRP